MVVLPGLDFMAIGDSITYGFGAADVLAHGAWRYYAGQTLVSTLGGQVRWVGDNPALGTQYAGNLMLGASGQRVDDLLGNTYKAAQQFLRWRPSAYLIHIGTNDVNQTLSGVWVGGSEALSIANLSTLLDNIRTATPVSPVILAKIIPNQTGANDAAVTSWNAAMATMVAARSDVDYIFTSDCNGAFKANPTWAADYMNDSTHPNDAGESVIGSTLVSTLLANVNTMPRTAASSRKAIIPSTASLYYNSSTATDLGSSVFLDTTKPWAVEWLADISPSKAVTPILGTFWQLKTDRTNSFKVLYNGPYRGLDFGGPTDFGRWFALAGSTNYSEMSYGWHHHVLAFDGVDRTAVSSYSVTFDGVTVPLTSGSGLANTGNVNTLGTSNGSSAGLFYMSRFRVWNGGTAMSATQMSDLCFNNILPTGPTLTHEYLHTDGSGSTLTDSVGGANGTIGTATWSTNIPFSARVTIGVARSALSTDRTVVS